jgi:hypothetical protein
MNEHRPFQLLTHLPRTLAAAAMFSTIPLIYTACGEIKTNNKVEVAPIEVKPIHITVDVNLRIDRSLDEFFSFQRPGGAAVVIPVPTTGPTTAPR